MPALASAFKLPLPLAPRPAKVNRPLAVENCTSAPVRSLRSGDSVANPVSSHASSLPNKPLVPTAHPLARVWMPAQLARRPSGGVRQPGKRRSVLWRS
jgi:hypothetical protein